MNLAFVNNGNKLMGIFENQILEHQKYIDYESNESTDFAEAYFKEMKKLENEPNFGGFGLANIDYSCLEH